MFKTLMIALTLLCSAAWFLVQGQNSTSQDTQTMQGSTAATGQQVSVQGCLQGQSGTFMITDSSGTTYQLQGDTSKLTKHVGHQVQVTGTSSNATASSTNRATSQGAASQGAGQTLTVVSLKHISDSCKTAGK